VVPRVYKYFKNFPACILPETGYYIISGVEEAFSSTNKVMTVSVHKYAVGFFPGKIYEK
jgi:hypothetical protein